ncbi:hypothetical protein GCM10008904_10190 [Paraclostridium ghonii]|uniref:Uncharacterized protein n=1 Tax=Paraclostridium ghonii TaxID=29358 RepID=A0ABU0MYH3_9FIRM|nr:hypothetical protein [Paeniclostridium ghonii]MDQ0555952.1 hypothetical protein [Paeniclostridium ghonii]
MYKFVNNINSKYLNKLEKITSKYVSLEEKKLFIIEITEEYFYETNKLMPEELLIILANWFLECILKSKDVDKVSKSDYPILSYHQIKRRNNKQLSVPYETLDYINQPKSKKVRCNTE